MSSAIDLDAYCRRIGYAGPRIATLDVLRELVDRDRRAGQRLRFSNGIVCACLRRKLIAVVRDHFLIDPPPGLESAFRKLG